MKETYEFHWIAIDDISEPKPDEHETCVICMECPHESDWHLQIAHWYFKDAELDCVDSKGKSHVFHIQKDGFYLIDETTEQPRVFLAHGVKFWTKLPKPKIKPDDILTIE